MSKINAKQLAFLLGISQKNANYKILYCLFDNIEQVKIESSMNDNWSVDSELFESKTGIPVKMALNDLYNNALKRKSFAKYLLKDYIEECLNVPKPKKKIRLPEVPRSMLSPETISQVSTYWEKNYYGKRMPKWEKSIDYYPELVP